MQKLSLRKHAKIRENVCALICANHQILVRGGKGTIPKDLAKFWFTGDGNIYILCPETPNYSLQFWYVHMLTHLCPQVRFRTFFREKLKVIRF